MKNQGKVVCYRAKDKDGNPTGPSTQVSVWPTFEQAVEAAATYNAHRIANSIRTFVAVRLEN